MLSGSGGASSCSAIHSWSRASDTSVVMRSGPASASDSVSPSSPPWAPETRRTDGSSCQTRRSGRPMWSLIHSLTSWSAGTAKP